MSHPDPKHDPENVYPEDTTKEMWQKWFANKKSRDIWQEEQDRELDLYNQNNDT